MVIPCFLAMLTAHVLSDFYLQSDKMAREKTSKHGPLAFHSAIYAIAMFAALLFVGATFAAALACAVVFFASHFAVDGPLKKRLSQGADFKWTFFVDQAIHLGICGMVAIALREGPAHFAAVVSPEMAKLLMFILAVLILWKPAEIAVRELLSAAIVESPKGSDNSSRESAGSGESRSGRYIGILERLIVLAFVAVGEYSSVGFVIAAKSVARFKRIEEDPDFAERYLIGTLASVLAALSVAYCFVKLTSGDCPIPPA